MRDPFSLFTIHTLSSWIHSSAKRELKNWSMRVSFYISPPYRVCKGRWMPLLPNPTLESIQADQFHLKASQKRNHWLQSAADPLLTYRIRPHSSYSVLAKPNKKQGVLSFLPSMFIQVCDHQNREGDISVSLEYKQESSFFPDLTHFSKNEPCFYLFF